MSSGEDWQWCNTHGTRHSIELRDPDCEFPHVVSAPPPPSGDASGQAQAAVEGTAGGSHEASRKSPTRLLWDSQWVNIVNHHDCWDSYSVTDAVETAVRLAEDAITENILRGEIPDDLRAAIRKATAP